MANTIREVVRRVVKQRELNPLSLAKQIGEGVSDSALRRFLDGETGLNSDKLDHVFRVLDLRVQERQHKPIDSPELDILIWPIPEFGSEKEGSYQGPDVAGIPTIRYVPNVIDSDGRLIVNS